MCDYCGCRRSGPTAELAEEHVRLRELGDVLQMPADRGELGLHVRDRLRLERGVEGLKACRHVPQLGLEAGERA